MPCFILVPWLVLCCLSPSLGGHQCSALNSRSEALLGLGIINLFWGILYKKKVFTSMMKILLNLNFRFILNCINCLMTSLNIITRGWTLCWKNIVEIIYLIIIAIIVMVVYVYYFAVLWWYPSLLHYLVVFYALQ